MFNRMMKVKMRVNKGTLQHSLIQHFFFSIYYSEILSFALEIQQQKGKCSSLPEFIFRWRSQIQINTKSIKLWKFWKRINAVMEYNSMLGC